MNKTVKRILFSVAAVLAGAVVSFLLIGAVFKASIPEMFMTEEERKAAAVQAVSGGLAMRELSDVRLVPGISELQGAEDGSIVALVTTEGFDGDVTLRIGVAADGTITGITAVSHSETPEVGAMALQSEYLDGYLGADSADAVDAYAGASFTSAAIREAVDRAMIQYKVANGIEVKIPVEEDEAEEPSDPFADRPVIYITTKTEEAPAPEKGSAEVSLVEGVSEFSVNDDGSVAVTVTTHGYDSDITFRITVAADGTVADIEVLSQKETPALGGKALKNKYLNTYKGVSSTEGVDAYTGASFTSAAIREAVDKALAQRKALSGEATQTEATVEAVETAAESAEAVCIEGVSESVTNADGSVSVTVTTRGYDSGITFRITVAADGTVADIEVLSQKETPALGGKALKNKYLNTYKGISSTDGVDAYTGASFTSKAIREAVDKALDSWKLSQGMEIEVETAPDPEEVLAAVLAETPGEWEKLEVEPVSELIKAVYHSDAGYGIYAENQGHYEDVLIRLLVRLDENGILQEIRVIEQNETEGYGANVFNEAYLNFYKGAKQFKTVPLDFIEGKMIDMYSGATDTSLSVFNMVDAAAKQYAALS